MGRKIANLNPGHLLSNRRANLRVNRMTRLVPPAAVAAAVFGAVLSLGGNAALADIRFEDKGTRFSVDVRDEPIAKVMDSLSERFDFTVDGYPEHWSKDPMNFSATGDLERVLRSLLKDTSHVFEYHTNVDTRETRIAALKLLNEGVAGFVANRPARTDTVPNPASTSGVTRGTGSRQPGRLADRPTGFDRDIATGSTGSNSAAANRPPATAVSGLSASLASRARQSSNATRQNAGASASSSAPAASRAPADPTLPTAEMQALTQKALQDVKGLAEALRQNEGK